MDLGYQIVFNPGHYENPMSPKSFLCLFGLDGERKIFLEDQESAILGFLKSEWAYLLLEGRGLAVLEDIDDTYKFIDAKHGFTDAQGDQYENGIIIPHPFEESEENFSWLNKYNNLLSSGLLLHKLYTRGDLDMSKKECTKTKFTNKKILPSKKLLIILALSAALIFLLSVSSVLATVRGTTSVANNREINLTTDFNSYGLATAYPPYGFVIFTNFTVTNLTINSTQGPYNVSINLTHQYGNAGLTYNISFYNETKAEWVSLGKNNGTIMEQ